MLQNYDIDEWMEWLSDDKTKSYFKELDSVIDQLKDIQSIPIMNITLEEIAFKVRERKSAIQSYEFAKNIIHKYVNEIKEDKERSKGAMDE